MEEVKVTPKKPRFSRTWKALTIVIALLILYTVYHIFYGLAESVKTTPAGLVEQSSSIILEGVIFREEEGIITNNKGSLRPYYYDGERVSVDSAVASVYTKGDSSEVNERIDELKEKLDILKKSNITGLVSIVDIEGLKSKVDNLYTTMMLALSDSNPLRAARAKKELLIAMNQLAICEGRVNNYNEDIAQIEAELDELYNSFKGDSEYIFADKGGYFYHSCDGYEDVLTEDKLSSLTSQDLTELLKSVKKDPTKKSGYTAKFVYNNLWKIATVYDSNVADLLKVGKQYNVILFDIRERELKFTLESIGEAEGDKRVLVFSCSDMPEGFDFTRYQEFRLDISSIEGYRVPKEAVVNVKDAATGEKIAGVYILDASVVEFKRIEIIGESDGYYIVSKLDKSKENYNEYLALNDHIILETNGMYDGKLMKR